MITFKGTTPPSINTGALCTHNGECGSLISIFVPSESVEAYKEALKNVPYKYDGDDYYAADTYYYASDLVKPIPQ